MPEKRLKPTLRNPFPQITEVAVVPFFDRTKSQNVDRSEFAQAYANELQKVPGFNVMSVQAVEDVMATAGITKLENADDIRRLGRLLGVEAVVIGYVNEFSSYTPPKCSLKVEWYSVNPYMQSIPNGFGLPWGTLHERDIPERIVHLSEHDLARVQLATQTPDDPNADLDYDTIMNEHLFEKQLRERARDLGISPAELRARLRVPEKGAKNGENDPYNYDEYGQPSFDETELYQLAPAKTDYELRQDAKVSAHLKKIGILDAKNDSGDDYFDEERYLQILAENQGSVPENTGWGMRNRANDEMRSRTPQTSSNNPHKRSPAPEPPKNRTPVQNTPIERQSEQVTPPQYQESVKNLENLYKQQDELLRLEEELKNRIRASQIEEKFGNNAESQDYITPKIVIPEIPKNSDWPSGSGRTELYSPQNDDPIAIPDLDEISYRGQVATSTSIISNPLANPHAQAMPQMVPIQNGQYTYYQPQPMQPYPNQVAPNVVMMPYVQPYVAPPMPGMPVQGQYPPQVAAEPETMPGLPENWPDARGFIPPGPKAERPEGRYINNGPIISHSAIYSGDDKEFTQALADYDFLFRDDKRVVSWQSIMNNRKEFIGFCCRLHIWEVFGARGGIGDAEKVWRLWKPWEGGERPF